MSNKQQFIFIFFIYAIPLLSMNNDKEREPLTADNKQIIITYPKPKSFEDLKKDLSYIALGTISPEEIEVITRYRWCPNPYNDRCCNSCRAGCCVGCSGTFSLLLACQMCAIMGLCPGVPTAPSCNQMFCDNGAWACTLIEGGTILSGLYALMPWHNENGCNLYKKVITKVLRKRNDTDEAF